MWIDMYLGPPKVIVYDSGPQFRSKEFVQNALDIGTIVKYAPVEAHYAIGLVERYHTMIRRAYDIIRKELPYLSKQHSLQIGTKAVNDSAGPDGLVPSLLLFGSYPRISFREATSTTTVERGDAIKKAMKEVTELNAKRNVTEALRTRNRPNINEMLGLAIGEEVLV